MYKKLDDGAIVTLLETGIDEFACNGLDKANINVIAKKAGLSVGAIYKYYGDKDNFFLSCVSHSLKLLESAIQDVLKNEDDIKTCIRLLMDEIIDGAEKHRNYFVMYNEINSGSCRKYAVELARQIEGKTGALYAALMEKARAEGRATYKGDSKMFAFFFDSLLMMLQFSFSCEYYRERMRIFCGDEILDDKEKLGEAFCEFIERAIGLM